ncbi:MAG: dTDP-glucose 4,6-dehydratase [Proteobacteria bacterium]|uniref:dTDP-glucose 4,6-dehydratase n=1 Tax=Candidatus Avisuccinivibrio stercorigallinarum TaxID=2840704 RepID=A0A9D9DAP5_9GAMM|nr:dTDP-glucose 4,6-dehydratase [Candidatus Avisuccinivibrio stercorigallinarum]
MSCLLITGGAGFIGSNYVHLKAQGEHRLIVADALHYAGRREYLQPLIDSGRITFIQADIRDTDLMTQIIEREQVNAVVNFAAHTHVDRSISDPAPFYQNNVEGTCSLLTAALRVFVEQGRGGRYHQVSTDEVYGTLGPDDPAFTELTPFAPNSPYSASKASADHFVRAFHVTYGLDTTISHCSNNYGPYQFPEKLLPLALSRLLYGEKIPVYGDGQQRRDWLYVGDHCRGIDLILEHGRSGERYNIGGGVEISNLQFLRALYQTLCTVMAEHPRLAERYPHFFAAGAAKAAGAQAGSFDPGLVPDFVAVVEHVTDRKGHDRRYALCDDKVRTELGYRPQMDFARGLKHTVLWYIEHDLDWHIFNA